MKINLRDYGSSAKNLFSTLAKSKIDTNVRHLVILLLFLLLLNWLFGPLFRFVLVFSVFVAIGAVSTFYYNFFHGPINFELVKFTTILTAIVYGIWAAILVGILGSVLGRVLSGRFDQRTLISILGIVMVAILAGIFKNQPIVLLGIALVALYHLILTPLSLMMGDQVPFVLIYALTNIAFNIFFFAYFAKLTLLLIGG